jgi:hypothetical protein
MEGYSSTDSDVTNKFDSEDCSTESITNKFDLEDSDLTDLDMGLESSTTTDEYDDAEESSIEEYDTVYSISDEEEESSTEEYDTVYSDEDEKGRLAAFCIGKVIRKIPASGSGSSDSDKVLSDTINENVAKIMNKLKKTEPKPEPASTPTPAQLLEQEPVKQKLTNYSDGFITESSSSDDVDMPKLQVPEYTDQESFAKYTKRIEKYTRSLQTAKYQLIVDFLNDWVQFDDSCKIKSLIQFKKVPRSSLTSNTKHNEKVIKKYNKKIKKVFKLEYKNPDIMYLATRMLCAVDYKFQFIDIKLSEKTTKNGPEKITTDTYCYIVQR